MRPLFVVLALLLVPPTQGQSLTDQPATPLAPGPATGPGPATTTEVLERGVLLLEQGLQYDFATTIDSYTFSNTVLRYGITDGVEVRAEGDLFVADGDLYFSGLTLGSKIALHEGEGLVPSVSLLGYLLLPGTASDEFDVDHIAPSLYLLMQHRINDWLTVGYNVGAEWDGVSPRPTAFLSLYGEATLSDRLECFVESFNNLWNPVENIYGADFGLSYMAHERVQLDLTMGLDLRRPTDSWLLNLVAAWRIIQPE